MGGKGDVSGMGMIRVHDLHTKSPVKPLCNQRVSISKKKVPLCSHLWETVPGSHISPRVLSCLMLGALES